LKIFETAEIAGETARAVKLLGPYI